MIPLKSFSQSTGELTTDSLVKMGFENVRWTDTPEERVYVVENSAYKIQALGIRKAVDIIQSMGLPKDKSCKLIVTNYNIPQVSLTYQPLAGDTTVVNGEDWKVSYDIGDSWDKVKKEKKKRRKRGLGESLILNIQDNHVRTMNEEKRNCEHLHRFPAPRRAGGICPGRSPGEKIENNT